MPTRFDSLRCEMRDPNYESYYEPLIYRYHSPSRPRLAFYANPDEVADWYDKLFFGVELEFDNPHYNPYPRQTRIDTIRDCNEIMQSDTYGYFMLDGSVRSGLEFITQPSTYNFYVSNRDKFERIFEAIKAHNYLADSIQTPGFHIHFNRDFYNGDEEIFLENLLFLIDRYWPNLVYCSKRRVASINRWSKKYDKTPAEIVDDMSNGHLPSRYHVLNLNNSSTYEFRLWHGTLDAHTFYSILTLVRNMVILAKISTKEEISKRPFECLLTNPEMAKFWIDASNKRLTRKYQAFLQN